MSHASFSSRTCGGGTLSWWVDETLFPPRHHRPRSRATGPSTPFGSCSLASWSCLRRLAFSRGSSAFSACGELLLPRLAVQVVHLERIVHEIEQLPLILLPEVDQLVRRACGRRSARACCDRPGRGSSGSTSTCASRPASGRAAPARRLRPCMSADAGRPGGVEERRREVDVERHRVAPRARLDRRRPADEERHAQRLLVHEPLVEQAVVAEEEALVAGVDDDRVAARGRPCRGSRARGRRCRPPTARWRGSPACSAGTSSGRALRR